jgi:hypothetical protein
MKFWHQLLHFDCHIVLTVNATESDLHSGFNVCDKHSNPLAVFTARLVKREPAPPASVFLALPVNISTAASRAFDQTIPVFHFGGIWDDF